MELFIQQLFDDPKFFCLWVGSVVVSISIHEFCHAFMAREFGDDLAATEGYMTLNPLKVMGPTSLVCLLLFGICWGRVPVIRERVSRAGQSVISAAGPIANFALMLLCGMLLRIIMTEEALSNSIGYSVFIFTHVNCILFIFNVLPIPNLDGWGIIEPFVPFMRKMSPELKGKIFGWTIFILWVTPASKLLPFLTDLMMKVILWGRIEN